MYALSCALIIRRVVYYSFLNTHLIKPSVREARLSRRVLPYRLQRHVIIVLPPRVPPRVQYVFLIYYIQVYKVGATIFKLLQIVYAYKDIRDRITIFYHACLSTPQFKSISTYQTCIIACFFRSL